jgi:hypothetical protein
MRLRIRLKFKFGERFGVAISGCGLWGVKCRALGWSVWDLEFRVWGLGFRVWGLEFRVWGLGFRV